MNILSIASMALLALAPGQESAAKDDEHAGETPLQVELKASSDSNVAGSVTLQQRGDYLNIAGQIHGLTPGAHGFHLHENADCSAADASSAGGHFAPADNEHGAPTEPAATRHAGDLGNIVADENGVASVDVVVAGVELNKGERGVIGRALVVHSGEDDLVSQPAGDAGKRVACGEINAAKSSADSRSTPNGEFHGYL